MASVGTIKYRNGSSWIDILHPVNSFYISYDSTSPASLFGGTWTQITDAVLRGATDVGYIGADTHTLTIDEMPSHNHRENSRISWTDNINGGTYTKYVERSNLQTDRKVDTGKTGGGQAMSLVQRSYNCFIWYRTA